MQHCKWNEDYQPTPKPKAAPAFHLFPLNKSEPSKPNWTRNHKAPCSRDMTSHISKCQMHCQRLKHLCKLPNQLFLDQRLLCAEKENFFWCVRAEYESVSVGKVFGSLEGVESSTFSSLTLLVVGQLVSSIGLLLLYLNNSPIWDRCPLPFGLDWMGLLNQFVEQDELVKLEYMQEYAYLHKSRKKPQWGIYNWLQPTLFLANVLGFEIRTGTYYLTPCFCSKIWYLVQPVVCFQIPLISYSGIWWSYC